MVCTKYIQIKTKGETDIIDITSKVENEIVQSNLNNGVITIFTPSSTSGVTTIEYEQGCLKDLKRFFEETISSSREYEHNFRWGDGNGHSHIRASLLGPSVTVPVINGKMALGTWQQIIFVDFDIRARGRRLILQMVGD